jgi:hypothetical protein
MARALFVWAGSQDFYTDLADVKGSVVDTKIDDATLRALRKLDVIWKTWGYRSSTDRSHMKYEELTLTRDLRELQYFTDPLMRNLQQISAGRNEILRSDFYGGYINLDLVRMIDLGIKLDKMKDLLREYFQDRGVANAFGVLLKMPLKNAPLAGLVGVARVLVSLAMGHFADAKKIIRAIIDIDDIAKTTAGAAGGGGSSSTGSRSILSITEADLEDPELKRLLALIPKDEDDF